MLFYMSVPLTSEMMATPLEDDTVWIGFMDIVPVIGTVKEAVELVSALYEGNEAVIKEKEKAVENIVKESLNKDMKVSHISISYIQRLTDSKANSPNIKKKSLVLKTLIWTELQKHIKILVHSCYYQSSVGYLFLKMIYVFMLFSCMNHHVGLLYSLLFVGFQFPVLILRM